MKFCPDCGQTLDLSSFNRNRGRRDGLQAVCRACQQERKWEARYGIGRAEYQRLLNQQDHRCKVCGEHVDDYAKRHAAHRHLVVDHDHTTGRVRGLLCNDCNTGLGMFRDDVPRLHSAIRYLCEG